MPDKAPMIVFDRTGLRGVAVPDATTTVEGNTSQVVVSFEDNQPFLVSRDMLTLRKDGNYDLPFSVAEIAPNGEAPTDTPMIIPVIEEQVQVQKRTIETGKVRIKKKVQEHQESVDIPLLAEEVEIRHVAVGRNVDGPVSARYEGDTLIIPLLEEVIVVQKQLRIKEEVHVTKKQTERHQVEQVTLRREEVSVEPEKI